MPALAKLTLLSTVARRALACLEAEAWARRKVVPAALRQPIGERLAAEAELAQALRALAADAEAVAQADPTERERLLRELIALRADLRALHEERRRVACGLRRLASVEGEATTAGLSTVRSGTEG